MIAAIASVFITPWNLFNNPAMIHYTLDLLGAFIGPLYGILIADYYRIQRQHIHVQDLYSMHPQGRYWYRRGVNPRAVLALIFAAAISIACVLLPALRSLADFTWFIGMLLGAGAYLAINHQQQ